MLSPRVWLGLPQPIRQKLAVFLELPRSGGTEVMDGQVISDGHTIDDLAKITVSYLQEVLGKPTETDFYKLWDELVANISAEPVVVGSADSNVNPFANVPEVIPTGLPAKEPANLAELAANGSGKTQFYADKR